VFFHLFLKKVFVIVNLGFFNFFIFFTSFVCFYGSFFLLVFVENREKEIPFKARELMSSLSPQKAMLVWPSPIVYLPEPTASNFSN